MFDDVMRRLRARCIERHGGVDVGAEESGLGVGSCVHEITKSPLMSSCLCDQALVCKQYWTKTLPVILGTSGSTFDDPVVLQVFRPSEHDHVARIHRLDIEARLSIASRMNDTYAWARAMSRRLIGRLEKLEGVSLTLRSDGFFNDLSVDPLEEPDVMSQR